MDVVVTLKILVV